MPDDLRTRIAKAIFRRFQLPHGDSPEDGWELWWHEGSDEDRRQFYDQADAVIAVLNESVTECWEFWPARRCVILGTVDE